MWNWLLIAAVLIGHFGLHLAIYNRLNGTSMPRVWIKRIERLFFVEMLITPIVVLVVHQDFFVELWRTGEWNNYRLSPVTQFYGWVCLMTWPLFGIPWLLWRPILRLEWVEARRDVTVLNVAEKSPQPLALTTKCKWESRLPFNQIFDLAIEKIELPVADLPKSLDGFRIAHLSDIHLTGDIAADYMKFVVRQANGWEPDVMTITGDIIDKQPCIDWLEEIFSRARAADGCYFVLGNHDLRVPDPDQTRAAMRRSGWTDLGGRSELRRWRDVDVEVIGNEAPWFPRPEIARRNDGVFRVLFSHSPDQLSWAREHNIRLMLAGHTHGGQGRLPLIGPLLSPSLHGSRYASGDFYKAPTTLHVSRGLAGVHLLRIRCRPELSLLTLRCE